MITVTTKQGFQKRYVGAVYLTNVIEGYLYVYTLKSSDEEGSVLIEDLFFIEDVISVKGE